MRVNLETERLILRNLVPEDYEAVFKWCGDPLVNKYMVYPLYFNAEDVKSWIEGIDPDLPGVYDTGIVLKKTGELIGSGSLVNHPERGAWEIGYNIRSDMWGNGYVPEMLRGLIAYVSEREEVRAIDGIFACENYKSQRVMEKLGMTFHEDTEFSKLDGSVTFKAKLYRKDLL